MSKCLTKDFTSSSLLTNTNYNFLENHTFTRLIPCLGITLHYTTITVVGNKFIHYKKILTKLCMNDY